MEMGAGNTA